MDNIFIAGVYGMSFDYSPELHYHYTHFVVLMINWVWVVITYTLNCVGPSLASVEIIATIPNITPTTTAYLPTTQPSHNV